MTETEMIDYSDAGKIKERLFGRKITAIKANGPADSYDRTIDFTLDDGAVLQAQAQDGGCGCSNGCFTVDAPNPEALVGGTILNVEVEETTVDYQYDRETRQDVTRQVEPGSISDGSATIRLFIYTDLDPHGRFTLVESEGGDNGFYGWGFNLTFTPANA